MIFASHVIQFNMIDVNKVSMDASPVKMGTWERMYLSSVPDDRGI